MMNTAQARRALLATSFAALLGFSQGSAAQQIKLRVADSFPTGHSISVNITKYMMEQLSALPAAKGSSSSTTRPSRWARPRTCCRWSNRA